MWSRSGQRMSEALLEKYREEELSEMWSRNGQKGHEKLQESIAKRNSVKCGQELAKGARGFARKISQRVTQ